MLRNLMRFVVQNSENFWRARADALVRYRKLNRKFQSYQQFFIHPSCVITPRKIKSKNSRSPRFAQRLSFPCCHHGEWRNGESTINCTAARGRSHSSPAAIFRQVENNPSRETNRFPSWTRWELQSDQCHRCGNVMGRSPRRRGWIGDAEMLRLIVSLLKSKSLSSEIFVIISDWDNSSEIILWWLLVKPLRRVPTLLSLAFVVHLPSTFYCLVAFDIYFELLPTFLFCCLLAACGWPPFVLHHLR